MVRLSYNSSLISMKPPPNSVYIEEKQIPDFALDFFHPVVLKLDWDFQANGHIGLCVHSECDKEPMVTVNSKAT